MEETTSGGFRSAGTDPLRSRRFAAALVDLVHIPIFLGILVGLLVSAAPEPFRTIVIVVFNIGWLLVRDAFVAPGRNYKWRKIINLIALVVACIGIPLAFMTPSLQPTLIFIFPWAIAALLVLIMDKPGLDENLKLVSLNGEHVSMTQALVRNLFLAVPFALGSGFFCEAARIFFPHKLMMRRVMYVFVIAFILLVMPPSFRDGLNWVLIGTLVALAVPVIFLVLDKAGLAEGDRLMDAYSHTRVIVG